MKQIKILTVTHKSYDFPQDEIYQPIQVGRVLSTVDLGILSDNEGINISGKNKNFCELTAIYWAWKNHFFADCDYVGLTHYRRFFKGSGCQLKGKAILSASEIFTLMQNYDAIVPRHRNYWIESIYSHYRHAHHISDLDCARDIIKEYFPDYIPAFNRVMQGKTLYLYNMFVLKKTDFDAYCDWLFRILFELEKRLDLQDYDAYQQRGFGFIAERLFNVWLVYRQLKICEVSVVNLEGEHLLKKAINLLKRKFLR